MNRLHRPLLATSLACMLAGCSGPEAPAEPAHTAAASLGTTTRPSATPRSTSSDDAVLHREAAMLTYVCDAGAPACPEALVARSPQEAAWLLDHGYPSSVLLARYAQLSRTELNAMADAGSLAAMVVYGVRAAADGDTREGIEYVVAATQRGSIYGYYGLSAIFQNSPELMNIVEAGTYLRVAYILGDAKAATELQRRLPGLTPGEQAMIDERAASLYQTMAGARAPAPRPLQEEH